MKATVRVHITIHVEATPFDLNWAHAGTLQLQDAAEAERFLLSLAHNVESAASMMSVVPLKGEHVPDLALAKGGDPERPVTSCTNCGHGPGYHSPENALLGDFGPCWAPMQSEDGQCTCEEFVALPVSVRS